MNPNLSPRQFKEYVPQGGFSQKKVNVRGTVGGFMADRPYEHDMTYAMTEKEAALTSMRLGANSPN